MNDYLDKFLTGTVGPFILAIANTGCFDFNRNVWDDLFSFFVIVLSAITSTLTIQFFRELKRKK